MLQLSRRAVSPLEALAADQVYAASVPTCCLQYRRLDTRLRLVDAAVLAAVAALPMRMVPARLITHVRKSGIRTPTRALDHISIASRARARHRPLRPSFRSHVLVRGEADFRRYNSRPSHSEVAE